MPLKQLMIPVTTSSDLPLVNNEEKHGIENSDDLFFKLAHKTGSEGAVELKDRFVFEQF